MRRRNILTLAAEAYYLEDGEPVASTVAALESTWDEAQITATTFYCTECSTPVHPCALGSAKTSPYFQARKPPHGDDCPRRPRDLEHCEPDPDGLGPEQAVVPSELVLLDLSDPAPGEGDPQDHPAPPTQAVARGATRRHAAAGPPGGRRTARTLELIVNHWLALGDRESRRAQPLSVPGVDQSTYLYCFKQIAPWHGQIAASAPRVFYAPLRWTASPAEDSEILALSLHAARPGGRPITCTVRIDRSGWSAAQRARLNREVRHAARRARELWLDAKRRGKSQPGAADAVTVFAVAEQDPADATVYLVRDIRLIHFTDREITQ